MKKILITFLISIIVLFTISEVSIWVYHNKELQKTNPDMKWIPFNQNPFGKDFTFEPQFFPNPDENWGRAPEGLEFKGKPIVLFGGSSTYGYNLEVEDTLSYKLANETKRPVYNRAMTAWGIQHMLEQSRFEELYEDIPTPEYIIYTFTDDQIDLLFASNISSYDFLLKENYLKFKKVNGKLKKIKEKNKLLALLKSTYTAKAIKNWNINRSIIQNEDLILNKIGFALKHFIETKQEIEYEWKDTKFVVFFYNDSTSNNILKSKLEENGFITISAKELTTENLEDTKYTCNNVPTKEAWNLLTPLIVNKLEIK